MKLPNRSQTKWTNVFNVQVNETTDLKGDSIIPAVWVRPDQSNFMLMIAYKNYTYNITTKVHEGNWINLKISQANGVQTIKLDYELVHNKTNSVPKTWSNVNLVTGNTNGMEKLSTVVHYRNFEIKTCKTKGKINSRIFFYF